MKKIEKTFGERFRDFAIDFKTKNGTIPLTTEDASKFFQTQVEKTVEEIEGCLGVLEDIKEKDRCYRVKGQIDTYKKVQEIIKKNLC